MNTENIDEKAFFDEVHENGCIWLAMQGENVHMNKGVDTCLKSDSDHGSSTQRVHRFESDVLPLIFLDYTHEMHYTGTAFNCFLQPIFVQNISLLKFNSALKVSRFESVSRACIHTHIDFTTQKLTNDISAYKSRSAGN